jgi:hypothetical protein
MAKSSQRASSVIDPMRAARFFRPHLFWQFHAHQRANLPLPPHLPKYLPDYPTRCPFWRALLCTFETDKIIDTSFEIRRNFVVFLFFEKKIAIFVYVFSVGYNKVVTRVGKNLVRKFTFLNMYLTQIKFGMYLIFIADTK